MEDYKPPLSDKEWSEKDVREATDCEDFRVEMREIQENARALREDRHHVQLVFNKGTVLALPEARVPADAASRFGISFSYKTRGKGYLFTAAVPLEGLFDMRADGLGELAWLVDVSDVDAPGAAKQESLMSTSEARRYDDPGSFAVLPIAPAQPMRMTPYLHLLGALHPDGYYRADAAATGGIRVFPSWTWETI